MTKEQKTQILQMRQTGVGFADISRKLDLSVNTVKSFCRRSRGTVKSVEVQTKIHNEKLDSLKCRECGVLLVQKEHTKKRVFCSKSCREKWWKEHSDCLHKKAVYTFTCAKCEKTFTAYGNAKRKYCSHKCYVQDRFGGGSNDR